jgi:hypothetical protein
VKSIKIRLVSILILGLLSYSFSSAFAMGSGNPYLDAQTGLTYSLYKPVNTLGFAQTKFQLLVCGGGGEQWVYTRFNNAKKTIEVMQTMAGAHCSNPGLAMKMPDVKINGITARVFVYCDPTKSALAKRCTINDVAKVGGYLSFVLPGYYKMKPVNMQVQATGGVTYSQLVAVARSMTPASTKASN